MSVVAKLLAYLNPDPAHIGDIARYLYGKDTKHNRGMSKLIISKAIEAGWEIHAYKRLYSLPDKQELDEPLLYTFEKKSNANTDRDGLHVNTYGDDSNASTEGCESCASTNGLRSDAVTEGNGAHAGTFGPCSRAKTLGDRAYAVCFGNMSYADTVGFDSISCSLGPSSKARAENGWMILVNWHFLNDGRPTIVSIHHARVGDKIKGVKIKPCCRYWFDGGQIREMKILAKDDT